MKTKINSLIAFAVIFGIFVIALQIVGLQLKLSNVSLSFVRPSTSIPMADIEKFKSEQEFKDYLAKSQSQGAIGFGGMMELRTKTLNVAPGLGMADTGVAPSVAPSEEELQRFSETNVQVPGIDEPDILKTDGQEIYFSPEARLYYREIMPLAGNIMPPQYQENGIKAIKAFPPANLALDKKIEKTGEMLLNNNILVIFNYDKIYGYDVTDPKNPSEKWTVEYKNNSQLVSARLFQNKIYFITQTGINYSRPCPIEPLAINNQPISIKCVDIYYPSVNTQADITYNAMALDPQNGTIGETVSFVGSYQSIVYMSEKAIYLTYSYNGDFVKYQYNFYLQNADLVAPWVMDKLAKLQTYDISDQSKLNEMVYLLDKYYNSLSNDERLKIENETNNRLQAYNKIHARELALTGIIKINIEQMEVAGTGSVPGTPLNQFSIDEYQDNLRIATTIGNNWWGMGMMGGTSQSANDVYLLNKNLNIIGQVLDLGLGEQIYSVRFIEDKGYVVTFKRIDPFYVLNLADPSNPEKVGELKIPGYSSYLHPITADKILGIGEENNQVKISLFDVSNPANPTELAKYNLDEYYTDVQNNHHAFLLDTKHNVFFLPGGKGGYVFFYQNNELKLIKAISDIQAKRAVYINDYLYIVGDDKIVVLNEVDWEKMNELSF